jgi:hypothetical protein
VTSSWSVPLLLLTIGLGGCNSPTLASPNRAFDGGDGCSREAALDSSTCGAAAPAAIADAGADWGATIDGVGESEPDAILRRDGPGCGACRPDQYCLAETCWTKPELLAPAFPDCTSPPCINVLNNCPVPLWTHAIATVPLDDGNVRRLEPGQQYQYAGLPQFGGGRLYAYYQEPARQQDRSRLVSDYNQFVEMTVDRDATGALAQNYNISYVDSAALPVWVRARGAGCAETRCGAPYDHWTQLLAECPTELRNPAERLATCLGSYNYCISQDVTGRYDDTRPYCSKMRDAHGFPGSAIYGGTFPDRPASDVAFWDGVAAWNRGSAPGDRDEDHYYREEPYNHYARWLHRALGCGNVYAFSTDDHQEKAGFVRCTSPVLDVVWCPYD